MWKDMCIGYMLMWYNFICFLGFWSLQRCWLGTVPLRIGIGQHQIHTKLISCQIRTSEHLSATVSWERGYNFKSSYSSSIYHWIFPFYSKSYCVFPADCYKNIYGSRWRCKQKGKPFLSVNFYRLLSAVRRVLGIAL